MSEAEEISLKNYSSTLGFGVECEQSDVTAQIIDMFAVSFHFVSMIKIEGQIIEEKTQLTLSPCTKQDFFNEFNETFDSINLGNFIVQRKKIILYKEYIQVILFTIMKFLLKQEITL